jgi:hypothetical protein
VIFACRMLLTIVFLYPVMMPVTSTSSVARHELEAKVRRLHAGVFVVSDAQP